jgi:hypothetical protein
MHTINGYIFGNLAGLAMNNGERVRWHVLGMGPATAATKSVTPAS